jgi:mannose/fructose/N-acetylgalactosamine-specific phosphotransferase system component IIC
MLDFLTSKAFTLLSVPIAAVLTTLTVQGLKWASKWLDGQSPAIKQGAAAFFAAVFTSLFVAMEHAHPCVANAAGCTLQDVIAHPESIRAAVMTMLAFVGSLLGHKGLKAARKPH